MEIKRCYDTLIGASVGENQLVQSGATSVTVQSGHKYYAKINGSESLGTSTGSAITINDSAKDMVVDLTQMLGSAIADYVYSLGSNGIAKLREWGFLRGYQAFNAGSIESVEVTGKVVRGFNQFDKTQMTEHSFLNGDGTISTHPSYDSVVSDFIQVIPNTEYYFKDVWNIAQRRSLNWYDADKNLALADGIFASTGNLASGTKTSPSNAYYARIATPTSGADTCCINLSSSRNGEYEAYTSQSYALGSDVLRGIFKLDANNNLYADGDVKTSDGTITRKCRLVDLGTLNWNISETIDPDKSRFLALLPDMKATLATEAPSVISTKYLPITPNECYATLKEGITGRTSGGAVLVYDSAYASGVTAAAFKAAMSGVMLVYPLATPTTEQGDPFPSPQVCYPDGTEEYITGNGVPVGHETRYEL